MDDAVAAFLTQIGCRPMRQGDPEDLLYAIRHLVEHGPCEGTPGVVQRLRTRVAELEHQIAERDRPRCLACEGPLTCADHDWSPDEYLRCTACGLEVLRTPTEVVATRVADAASEIHEALSSATTVGGAREA